MPIISFTDSALDEYNKLAITDKRSLKKVYSLIKSIQRDGALNGEGKPEALKGRKEYSRRIDEKNRLIYRIDENYNIIIVSCRGHYED